jgi:hypothetical protein
MDTKKIGNNTTQTSNSELQLHNYYITVSSYFN